MTEKKIVKLGLIDPSSYSNPEKIKTKEMQLFWDLNFTRKVIVGKVILKCAKQEGKRTNHLILDTKCLKISRVTNQLDHTDLEYDIGESSENFGSSLCITLPQKCEDIINICIEYETSPDADALQWLEPEQTVGKQEPFMFSQCQAILSRSIVPCQDTPSVKFTFKADVTAPRELTVLMGALKSEEPITTGKDKLLWKYYQPIPIPSYLIAIAAGKLKAKVLGGKTKVYSEPELLKESAAEFSDTEKMLNEGTKICGPYIWGRYDLLVLPPSFPYGGMENPCLTFVTPTLLAGDKSLTTMIAHEIAHSWSGNLVTNYDYEHLWLNEGFTTYLERKIIGAMHGEPRRHFQAILGLDYLHEAVVLNFGEKNPLTCLVPKLKRIHPDEVLSCIPYEKGHTLLFYLETLLNEDGSFNKFIHSYFEKFKFRSLKTENFKSYLYEFYRDKTEELDSIDWNAWFYCPGMPPVIPAYDGSLASVVESLIQKWESWAPTDGCLFGSNIFSKSDITGLLSEQMCLFLSRILQDETFSLNKVILMNQVYQMEEVKNLEVKFRWIRLCIKVRWNNILTEAFKFVNEMGRIKFIRPIYKDLYEWKEARQATIENFLENKHFFMTATINQVERDLHLNKPSELTF